MDCRNGPVRRHWEAPTRISGRLGGPSPQNTVVRYTDELARLEESLDHIGNAPADGGTVELIARRPAENEREALREARLCLPDAPPVLPSRAPLIPPPPPSRPHLPPP